MPVKTDEHQREVFGDDEKKFALCQKILKGVNWGGDIANQVRDIVFDPEYLQ